jgi:hypothetical protein
MAPESRPPGLGIVYQDLAGGRARRGVRLLGATAATLFGTAVRLPGRRIAMTEKKREENHE